MTLMPTVGADRPSGVRERSSPRLARLARLRTWVTCLRGAWPNHSWSIQWWHRYMDGYPIPEHWTSPKSAGGVG